MIPDSMTHMQQDSQILKAMLNLATSRSRIRSTTPLSTLHTRKPLVSNTHSIRNRVSILHSGHQHLLLQATMHTNLRRTSISIQTMPRVDLNIRRSIPSRLRLNNRIGTATTTQMPHRLQQGMTRNSVCVV
jgi:hypothetical protein